MAFLMKNFMEKNEMLMAWQLTAGCPLVGKLY
jgi:hypothetical protein